LIEVDERVGRPELLLQLFAGHDVSAARYEEAQHFERLRWQTDAKPVLPQLAAAADPSRSTANDTAAVGWPGSINNANRRESVPHRHDATLARDGNCAR
jgi:hypothetical protein